MLQYLLLSLALVSLVYQFYFTFVSVHMKRYMNHWNMGSVLVVLGWVVWGIVNIKVIEVCWP
jgi:hypothetical protein